MKIETQRLILRDYRPEDLEIYYTLKAEPTVWEDLGGAAVHQKGEAAKLLGDTIASQISSDTGYRALCLKDGTFIGEAGILQVNKNDNRCRLGYRLLPAYWGNGYATEIVTALAQLAFRVLKMERVEALLWPKTGPPAPCWKKRASPKRESCAITGGWYPIIKMSVSTGNCGPTHSERRAALCAAKG